VYYFRATLTYPILLPQDMEGRWTDAAPSSGSDVAVKWKAQHAQIATKSGRQSWTSQDLNQVQEQYPGIKLLSCRELDMLIMKGVAFPEAKRRFIDVSQAAGWAKCLQEDAAYVGYVTPGIKLWVTDQCRILTGREMLRLQGIAFSQTAGDEQRLLATFSDDLLRDLSGNAFHSGSFAASFLSTLCSLSTALARSKGSKVHTIRKCALFQSTPLLDDDESDADLDSVW
jgi:hypothetical protein